MKALIFFTVLFIFTMGGVYFFHDPKSSAQTPPPATKSPDRNIEKSFDERLNRVEDKVTEAAQVKPRTIIKKVTIIKEVPVEEHKNLLTIGGEQYEVEPLEYKGYNVFNVDSIQKAIVDQEAEEAMYRNDTLTQAIIEEADERINLWQKVKSFFKRKK